VGAGPREVGMRQIAAHTEYQRARRRRRIGVFALLGAGWFIHDAAWHAALVIFGVNRLVGLEFGLPDLAHWGYIRSALLRYSRLCSL
jgi:hypothetical protein